MTRILTHLAAYAAGIATIFAAAYLWLDHHLLVQR